MNEPSHKHRHEGHGTLISYVVGFALSLLLTITAYILVVNKVLSGKTLLSTILGFAILQMAVQIFFFLHLGRGPKPLYNVIFFAGTAGLIVVVVLGSIFIMDNLQYNMTPKEVTKKLAQGEGISEIEGKGTGACQELGTNHKVTIANSEVIPLATDAKLCDTLTFTIEDDKKRDIAFGPHPKHENYAGQEVNVTNRRPKSITLNEVGTFMFHDHLDPNVVGYFTVKQ